MWNLNKKKKKDTNELISKTERDSQIQKKKTLMVTKGERRVGGMDKLGVWN